MNAMTFEKDGDYVVAKINGKEVARTKMATLGITEDELDEKLENYQLKLTAGDNITIEEVDGELVISATGGGDLYRHYVSISCLKGDTEIELGIIVLSSSNTPITDYKVAVENIIALDTGLILGGEYEYNVNIVSLNTDNNLECYYQNESNVQTSIVVDNTYEVETTTISVTKL